ncbi:MAG: cupin domain-containing protein [Burkholderiales bacterium]|nr:cupin domain-containing protein [Burkholderiales bacterium]
MKPHHHLFSHARAGAGALLAALACLPAMAQTPPPASPQGSGFVSAPLISAPITGDDGKEAVLVSATLAVGAATPVHRHPGDCIGTVVEGTIEMRIPGQEPRRYNAGQAYTSARGTTHQLVNVGTTPARFLNTLLVDKGKPRIEPVAAPEAK